MRGLFLGLVLALGACGDDGVHHLADAPPPPDAAPDAPPDAMVTPAFDVTAGATTVKGTRFSANVQIGHAMSQQPATSATRRFEANSAVKP